MNVCFTQNFNKFFHKSSLKLLWNFNNYQHLFLHRLKLKTSSFFFVSNLQLIMKSKPLLLSSFFHEQNLIKNFLINPFHNLQERWYNWATQAVKAFRELSTNLTNKISKRKISKLISVKYFHNLRRPRLPLEL